MEGPLGAEARALLAAARVLLVELVEEGVEEIPRLALQRAEPEATPIARAAPPRATAAPEPPPPERSARQPALLDAGPWGERPTLERVREVLGECRRCRLS